MKVYTFRFSSQYMDGFYQVIAETELRARELLGHGWGRVTSPELVSEFSVTDESERIVYESEIDNPSYEG